MMKTAGRTKAIARFAALAVLSIALGFALIIAPFLTKTAPGQKLSRFLAVKASAQPPVAANPTHTRSCSARIWGGLSDAAELLNGAAARKNRLPDRRSP